MAEKLPEGLTIWSPSLVLILSVISSFIYSRSVISRIWMAKLAIFFMLYHPPPSRLLILIASGNIHLNPALTA